MVVVVEQTAWIVRPPGGRDLISIREGLDLLELGSQKKRTHIHDLTSSGTQKGT